MLEYPTVTKLKAECLKLGGQRFQVPGIIERDLCSELGRTDWHKFDGTKAKLVKRVKGIPMRPCQCHDNSALLALAKGWDCWTGMALSVDGIWRTHSWVVEPKTLRVYETTVLRAVYYGVKLSAGATAELITGRIR